MELNFCLCGRGEIRNEQSQEKGSKKKHILLGPLGGNVISNNL
uniref:Uncharacterized protein n=1 Tax=Rhizophora mucronata TaxID=61149 RepID=A0A2P2PYX8_RHIMU